MKDAQASPMGRKGVFFVMMSATLAGGGSHAETTVIRPGPCAAQDVYLLAGNSGALIRTNDAETGAPGEHVIVFRPQPIKGWASRRLLRRFDLQLHEDGVRIFNSGAFCTTAR